MELVIQRRWAEAARRRRSLARFRHNAARDGEGRHSRRHNVVEVTSLAPVALALVVLVAASLWWAVANPGCAALREDREGADVADFVRPPLRALPGDQTPTIGADYDVRQALYASGILAKTDPVAAAVMARRMQPVAFGPGHTLDDQDEFCMRLYVIVSGKVKVSCRGHDGRQVMVAVLGPSEIFGALTLFDPEAEELSVCTLTDVVVVPIERRELLRWMAERQEVTEQVLRLFARWVKRTTSG